MARQRTIPTRRALVVTGVVALVILVGAIARVGDTSPTPLTLPTTTATPATSDLPSPSSPLPVAPVTPVEPATPPIPAPNPEPPAPASAGVAAIGDMLASLGADDTPASHGGYVRDYFKAWIDADRNGCNTRAEVLTTESTEPIATKSTCTVTTGKWYSPYDDVWLTAASKVDIDHMVPLSEAWQSGAYRWDAETRIRFGNDLGYPASLIAVSATSNRSKGDQDPAKWMPVNSTYACAYVQTWVAVKWRWSLTVDSAERIALTNTLATCPELLIALPEPASVGYAG
jgi:hypothetical protein